MNIHTGAYIYSHTYSIYILTTTNSKQSENILNIITNFTHAKRSNWEMLVPNQLSDSHFVLSASIGRLRHDQRLHVRNVTVGLAARDHPRLFIDTHPGL